MLGLEKAADQELIVCYQAMVPEEPAVKLRPGWISREVLKATGMLICERLQCTSRLVLPCATIERGWHLHNQDDTKTWIGSRTSKVCLIWPQLEDPARCVAIQEQIPETPNRAVALRRSECTSCCTTSLVREWPHKDRKKIFHLL